MNIRGGFRLAPELAALILGLTLYTTAFIGEIVRSGMQGVPRGQAEAAAALGLDARRATGSAGRAADRADPTRQSTSTVARAEAGLADPVHDRMRGRLGR